MESARRCSIAGHEVRARSSCSTATSPRPGSCVVRLDHDPDRHDDRAVALALASFALTEQRGGPVEIRAYSPNNVRGARILSSATGLGDAHPLAGVPLYDGLAALEHSGLQRLQPKRGGYVN